MQEELTTVLIASINRLLDCGRFYVDSVGIQCDSRCFDCPLNHVICYDIVEKFEEIYYPELLL